MQEATSYVKCISTFHPLQACRNNFVVLCFLSLDELNLHQQSIQNTSKYGRGTRQWHAMVRTENIQRSTVVDREKQNAYSV